MLCKNCGANIPEDAEVCSECGMVAEKDVKETAEAVETGVQENDGFFGENDEADEIVMADGISEDTEEIAAEDGVLMNGEIDEDGNVVYFTDVSEVPEEPKKRSVGKIVISVFLILIVALAGFVGIGTMLGLESAEVLLEKTGVAKMLGIEKEEYSPLIFVQESEKGNYLCIDDYNGNTVKIIKNYGDSQTFTKGSDFVVGGKNVFYLNDGSLYLYAAGKAETQKIAKNVSSASMVASDNGKTVLFIMNDGKKNVLCSYKVGKKVNEIAELEKIKFEAGGKPCYGFLDGTEKEWYIVRKGEDESGELFADGKNILKNVSDVMYISKDAKDIVYISADGTDRKLMLVDGGDKAKTLVEKYSEMSPAYLMGKKNKGILWLGDVKEDSEGKGTLYYKAFGKETVAIDTEVGAYIPANIAGGITEENENDVVFYMQGEDIVMAKGAKKVKNPEGFEYETANQIFSEKGDRIVYTNKDGKLVYSDWKKGEWGPVETIADGGFAVDVNEKADLVAFIEKSDDVSNQKRALSLYCAKEKKSIELTDNTNMAYFAKDEKTLYYTDNISEDGKTTSINYIVCGKESVCIDKNIGGIVPGSVKDSIVFRITENNKENIDIYTIKDGKLVPLADNVMKVYYY